jgi:sigma factor regulatory protein, fecR/pupR family
MMIGRIVRWITGRSTEKDLARIDQWLESDSENARTLLELEQIYDHLHNASMPARRIDKALERVHRRIEEEDRAGRKIRFLRHVYRYAAVVAVLVASAAGLWLWQKSTLPASPRYEYVLVRATGDHPRKVTLPDGSRVWLNRNAALQYPKNFQGQIRKVTLRGEGYFEVAKNRHKPFVVENEAMCVRVLGTVFNFKSNAAEGSSTVSLIEGSVEVKSHQSADQMVLTPGQRANVDRQTGRITVEETDLNMDVMWHSGIIRFQNANIRSIASILEKVYGVKIVIDEGVDERRTYSGAVPKKEHVDAVLLLLRNTLPVTYRKAGGRFHIMP